MNEYMGTNYAGTDPRSVKAMLENRDDGRGKAYAMYRLEALRANPGMSEDALAAGFRVALSNGWVERKRSLAIVALVVSAVYAAAVTYWVFVKDLSGLLN